MFKKNNGFCVLILMAILGLHFYANALPNVNKTFIVTGASGELGGAIARLLAQDNNLILTGRDSSKLKKLQEELKAASPNNFEVSTLDFVSDASRKSFINYLNQNHASIAGLVLITPRPQFYGKGVWQEENVWLDVIQNTFTGPLEVLKNVVPYLANPSKVVVIAGTTSIQVQPETGPNGVIRRMWTTYNKILSHQLGPKGISINTVSPGVVMTDFHQKRIQKKANDDGITYNDQMEKEVANIPLRRHAKPQEVAQTVKFLLSEQSDFINGVNLLLDGGLTLSY